MIFLDRTLNSIRRAVRWFFRPIGNLAFAGPMSKKILPFVQMKAYGLLNRIPERSLGQYLRLEGKLVYASMPTKGNLQTEYVLF
jgi:hypothetical protein